MEKTWKSPWRPVTETVCVFAIGAFLGALVGACLDYPLAGTIFGLILTAAMAYNNSKKYQKTKNEITERGITFDTIIDIAFYVVIGAIIGGIVGILLGLFVGHIVLTSIGLAFIGAALSVVFGPMISDRYNGEEEDYY